jgi:phosphohistidine phosphatase
MTLRLILTRHAKSDWSEPGQDDYDRPLNHRGRRDAPRLGRWLTSRGDVPDLILCSSAERTRETCDLIVAALPGPPQVRHIVALYHASPEIILSEIHKAEGRIVMVVGHNPGIGALAGALLHQLPTNPRFRDYPTAATAVIDFGVDGWAAVHAGGGALRDFVTPDDL